MTPKSHGAVVLERDAKWNCDAMCYQGATGAPRRGSYISEHGAMPVSAVLQQHSAKGRGAVV